MKHYEEVLKILHDKFDWKLTNSLTTTGKKLVADTIKALKIAENNQALQLKQTGVSTCFLEDVTDDVFNMGYKQVSCCKIAPITNENYCPNCGKKILK